MATRNIVPRADGEGSLGTNLLQWADVQTYKINGMTFEGINNSSDWEAGVDDVHVPSQWSVKNYVDYLASQALGYEETASENVTAEVGTGYIVNELNLTKFNFPTAETGNTINVIGFNGLETLPNSFSIGGNLLATRRYGSGAGTTNAGLVFGGGTTAAGNSTEEYTGSVWGSGNVMNVYRSWTFAGFGTQSAGMAVGGQPDTNTTEEYDGINWTNSSNMNEARRNFAGTGTQSAGMVACGYTDAGGLMSSSETFNGSVWSNAATCTRNWRYFGMCGSQNDAYIVGDKSARTSTSEYNGSAWSTGDNLVGQRSYNGATGSQSAAATFSGQSGEIYNTSEEYDGTAWKLTATILVHVFGYQSFGSQSNTLVAGGWNAPAATTYAVTQLYSEAVWAVPGVWSMGGNALDYYYSASATGTSTASLQWGGIIGSISVDDSSSYDGISWTRENNMTMNKSYSEGFGTQTTAMDVGGYIDSGLYTDNCQKFNGTSWTNTTSLPVTTGHHGGCGTQSAGLIAGGYNGSSFINTSQEFNGSVWSSGGNLSSIKGYVITTGSQSAALTFGGYTSASLNTSEEYDGTSWEITGSMSIARYAIGGGGTSTSTIVFGGRDDANNKRQETEKFNGTVWSFNSLLNIGRSYLASCGSQSGSLAITGKHTPTTEEYNTITINNTHSINGVWSAGGTSSVARRLVPGLGTQSAAVLVGGYTTVRLSITEEYNGISYTTVNSLLGLRSQGATAGTQSAGLVFCGANTLAMKSTEHYDGTTWTYGGDLSQSKYYNGGCGTQTAALSFGGNSSIRSTEEYDGIAWAIGGDIPISWDLMGSAGTQNAALGFSGRNSDAGTSICLGYNGTSWSYFNKTNSEYYTGGCGTQSDALAFSNVINSIRLGLTEDFNGSTWSFSGICSVGVNTAASAGSSTSALKACGNNGNGDTNITEHYDKIGWSVGTPSGQSFKSKGLADSAFFKCIDGTNGIWERNN